MIDWRDRRVLAGLAMGAALAALGLLLAAAVLGLAVRVFVLAAFGGS